MSEDCASVCSCAAAAVPVEALVPPGTAGLVRSTFSIPGMDCPAEEQLIRLRLATLPVAALRFDLPARTLIVDHAGEAATVLAQLLPLGYGASLRDSLPLDGLQAGDAAWSTTDMAAEARVLWLLLGINAAMFAVEIVAGLIAHSAGLVADAMDMFADAAVYGVALYAVGRAVRLQLAAARLSGFLQLLLGLGALSEVARHVLLGSTPGGLAMIGIAALALLANVACLLLIHRHRHRGAHMQASYIFSANDVIANLGVLAAGLLVGWSGSAWPDWVIGSAIGLLVIAGAVRILRLR